MTFIEIIAVQRAEPEPPMPDEPDPSPPMDPRVARFWALVVRLLEERAKAHPEPEPPRPPGYISTRILRDRERPHRLLVVSEFDPALAATQCAATLTVR